MLTKKHDNHRVATSERWSWESTKSSLRRDTSCDNSAAGSLSRSFMNLLNVIQKTKHNFVKNTGDLYVRQMTAVIKNHPL